MAMRRFYSEIKGKKVTELPEHVKPMLSFNYIKNSIKKGLDNYGEKYIETDSLTPLYHVLYGGMAFSYLVALPNERRHLAHKEHAESHH
ncbi:hypothetical protein MtrunA17_Chr2g0298691 [Medicago truncatula]|uniref:Fiber protein Fb15 n=1 Tax=Medicago truncatula TaxID=3880 RepID=G7IG85_MEDTR|nr:uncharacterized protein LOC11443216 [Medicago truncatula]AES65323.2 fiber protein Fb15 [Medicago truncatula]AFK48324.1 unknown [Medicago truncatula]RHN73457.1 hypothetical protein MtrunA17_Chr2g0298691 [Medicago truncatula]